MADTKISALTDGTTADATDKIPVERSGANRYITPGYIRTHIVGQANTFTGNQTVSSGNFSVTSATNPVVPSLNVVHGASTTGTTLSGVEITGTAGEFSCNATTLTVGETITISGTFGGTGSITGYSNPTTYRISATNGSTTFTLVNAGTGAAIVTTAGTPTGLTYTLTAPLVEISPIWNNSNVQFTGIRGNITNTASRITSRLIDLQVGGQTYFRVDVNGRTWLASSADLYFGSDTSQLYVGSVATSRIMVSFANYEAIQLSGDTRITWQNNASNATGGSPDVGLYRDAAGVLAQRYTTTAQTFRVYNTYSAVDTYERGFMRWNSNVLEIGMEQSNGTNRILRFTSPATGVNTAWEMRGSGSVSPRFVLAGTDRSVSMFPESNLLAVASGGFWSNLDYSAGASSTQALRSSSGNQSTHYFGLIGAAAGVMQLNTGQGRGSGYGASLEMWEMTAPSAPATNGVRIYAEDNGSGKTRLMALFPTGAAQQIAIEP